MNHLALALIRSYLAITHEICRTMDENYQSYGGMFDICKAFDKVWHEALIFKLQQNGILGKVMGIAEYSLNNGKQKAVLSRQASN